MKRILMTAAALLLIAGIFTSCGPRELRGFKSTNTGLHYKFYVQTDAPRAQLGDIIVAEIWVYVGGELEFTNAGMPEPLFQIMPSAHDGDLMEALMMVGRGDSVKFAFDLETLRRYNPGVVDDGNRFLFYTMKIDGVYNEEEFEIRMEMEQMIGEAVEAEILAAFIEDEGITVRPNADGVYIITTRTGSGVRATRGRTIEMNYVGRLLDGTVFDTNLEDVARENGLFTPMRQYVPLPFQVGVGQVIQGMDNALVDMRAGSKVTLIIPSNMAYGSRNMDMIPPFSTLIFEVEIVAVN